MDILNKTDIDRFYDLTVTPEKTILPIQLLCNQFVHCYTYANISDTGNNFSGIFFVSDQYKDKHIYSICVKKLCNIFFTIGKDDICSLSSSRNVKTNEMMPMLKLGPYYFDRHCLCFDLIRLIKLMMFVEQAKRHMNSLCLLQMILQRTQWMQQPFNIFGEKITS